VSTGISIMISMTSINASNFSVLVQQILNFHKIKQCDLNFFATSTTFPLKSFRNFNISFLNEFMSDTYEKIIGYRARKRGKYFGQTVLFSCPKVSCMFKSIFSSKLFCGML
jgi:hypothetical protein